MYQFRSVNFSANDKSLISICFGRSRMNDKNMKAEILLICQLRNNFMLSKEEEDTIKSGDLLREAENRAISALSGFYNKYFNLTINLFNSVMYCNYLYWVSHLLYRNGAIYLAEKVYYLNKMLNLVELFYEIEFPDIWSCEHPIGSVMGRAKYGNYFFYYQGCTVGGNRHQGKLQYPIIGEHVTMFSDSKILGNSHIGNNVILAANACVINQDVPNNYIVFGQSPNIVLKKLIMEGD